MRRSFCSGVSVPAEDLSSLDFAFSIIFAAAALIVGDARSADVADGSSEDAGAGVRAGKPGGAPPDNS